MEWVIALTAVVLLITVFILLSKAKSKPTEHKEIVTEKKSEEIHVSTTEEKRVDKGLEKSEISFKERLRLGLSRSRTEVWSKVSQIFTGNQMSDDHLDSIEELLYGADIGTATVSELIEAVKKKNKEEPMDENGFKQFLFTFLKEKISPIQSHLDSSLFSFVPEAEKKTKVIMVVGVNGAGKTTTIGKLATKLRAQGASVVVGACDTFRAAAVDQLQVWCDRSGATMIRAKEGANPSGVGYDALQAALNQQADYCILDTAGRLHTKENLMDELAKSKNVLKKLDPNAPHQVLLVIDAITGQNALRQAEEFHKSLNLTGLIFTKCDGSSKAGSAVSIVDQLKLPIAYIGVGETAQDLDLFNVDDYLNALLGREA